MSSQHIHYELAFAAEHIVGRRHALDRLFQFWADRLQNQARIHRRRGDWRTACHAALASVAFRSAIGAPKDLCARRLQLAADSVAGDRVLSGVRLSGYTAVEGSCTDGLRQMA